MLKNYDEEDKREVKVVRGGVVIKKERREEEKELGEEVESKRGRNMKGVKGGIIRAGRIALID